jgi:hypothetical protein
MTSRKIPWKKEMGGCYFGGDPNFPDGFVFVCKTLCGEPASLDWEHEDWDYLQRQRAPKICPDCLGKIVLSDGTHLVCADTEQLHAFARRIGLRRQWFQEDGKYPHYDLTTSRAAARAISAGAVKMDTRQMIRILRGAKV